MRDAFSATGGTSPLVFDSPHSGTHYPDDFGHACDLNVLRGAEDTHVERLYDFVTEFGAAFIHAHFPRSYIDANRAVDEIDPQLLSEPWPGSVNTSDKVLLGKGLIWRLTDNGEPLYRRKLSPAEVQRRIDTCWQPYHAAVAQAIDAAHRRHGFAIHVNCHSMPSVAGSHATLFPGLAHPDFVLGDRDGTTADPALNEQLARYLRARGFSVGINAPYKGVELVRRYGDPALGRHSIQVEINRRLYMDEATLELHDGWQQVQEALRGMTQLLASTLTAAHDGAPGRTQSQIVWTSDCPGGNGSPFSNLRIDGPRKS